jgi:hypothetical protein
MLKELLGVVTSRKDFCIMCVAQHFIAKHSCYLRRQVFSSKLLLDVRLPDCGACGRPRRQERSHSEATERAPIPHSATPDLRIILSLSNSTLKSVAHARTTAPAAIYVYAPSLGLLVGWYCTLLTLGKHANAAGGVYLAPTCHEERLNGM